MTTQTKDLTKEEAIKALEEGKRVRHRYFIGNEYMFLINIQKNIYKFEDGVEVNAIDFWKHRPQEQYLTGWEIV